VQKSTTRPNLRLVVTEDDDQFDLFADSPSENFWTEDDQTGTEAAAEPEAHADPDPAPLPDTRAGHLLNAAQRGTLSPAAIETLLAGSGRNRAPRIRFWPANVNLPLSFG
jgi:hypothetical protein